MRRQTWELYRTDFSVHGAWGSALALSALVATVVTGVLLQWGGWSGRDLDGWARLGGLLALAVVVVVALAATRFRNRLSCLSLAVGLGLLALAAFEVASAESIGSAVAWLVLASLALLVAISHYFSRTTLVVVAVVLVALVLSNTVRLGQATQRQQQVEAARATLVHLMDRRCTQAAAVVADQRSTEEAEQAAAADVRAAVTVGDAPKLAAAAHDQAADQAELKADLEATDVLDQAGRWIVFAWPDRATATEQLSCATIDQPTHQDSTPPADAQGSTANDASARGLAQNLAHAQLAVALAGQRQATGKAAEAAAADQVDTARASLADAVSATSPASSSTVLDLLSAGGDQVVASLPALRGATVPVQLAVAGWLVVAGLFLLLLRGMAIHASRGGVGPVTIDSPPEHANDLRVLVARNIPEPGSLPTAEALNAVTDLVTDAATADPAAKWIKPVVDAVTTAVNPPSGYDVTFVDINAPAAAPGAPASPAASPGASPAVAEPAAAPAVEPAAEQAVTALVADSRTKGEIALSVPFRGTGEDPWRTAAYWSVAVIFEHSIEVPSWASWRESASPALSAYFAREDTGADATDQQLEQALHEAPDNGILLMYAAGKKDLAGDKATSFLYALRAASSHPSYLVARYRLAVQASVFGLDPTCWLAVPEGARQEVLDLLDHATYSKHGGPSDRAAKQLRRIWMPSADDPPRAGVEHDVRDALVALGASQAQSLQRNLRVGRLVPGLLSRPQRRVTRQLFARSDRGQSGRRRLFDLARSVEVIAQAHALPDVRTRRLARREKWIVARAERRSSGWQLAYNVACLKAVQARYGRSPAGPAAGPLTPADLDEVYVFLWRALERPGSAALTAPWIQLDPDLADLATTHPPDPRYPELLARTKGAT